MHVNHDRTTNLQPLRRAALLGSVLALGLLGACSSGGGGGGGQIGTPGSIADKPGGGGLFIVDPNQGGGASRVRIAEMFWGRLVDVHDIDAAGEPDPEPVFTDFVINENIQSDVQNYLLETNPITQRTRLIVLRTQGEPEASPGAGTFADLVQQAAQNFPPITPLGEAGSPTQPFSFMARNATLVIRFDDLMDDGTVASMTLPQTVKLLTGFPPSTPFSARLLFDPNYGGVAGGSFHSTRVLLDMTVSESEAAGAQVPLPINSLGLPPSLTGSGQGNVAVRIPTRADVGAGQFALLRNLSGNPLATSNNGPVDFASVTVDVVRVMRSGNATDNNNGFLLDLNQPEIVGGWQLAVNSVNNDPAGLLGFDFVVSLTFNTTCRAAPQPGDIVSVAGRFLEVTQPASSPNAQGQVGSVRVRSLADDPSDPNAFLGVGEFLSPFDPTTPVPAACWLTFAPQPGAFPATAVSPNAQILVRFSEPMDPASVVPFDTFLVVRETSAQPPTATNIVVADVQPSSDLKNFTYTPVLPFSHGGIGSPYHIRLIGGASGVTDLAGNSLADALPSIDFTIDPAAAPVSNGGIVLRFNAVDEFQVGLALGKPDLRGQLFFDLDRRLIRPRPVSHTSVPADRTNPLPSIMVPFGPGVQTPVSPLGSKLQTVWRYADLGWQLLDESNTNVDVEGLSWSPVGAQVVADFYEEFEVRLAHSRKLPDEYLDQNLLPQFPSSGLGNNATHVNSPYASNILDDPLSPQKIVHPRSLGYVINPVNLFLSATGTFLMPFPFNPRLNPDNPQTYTWRDTAVLARGGQNGGGVPLGVEFQLGLAAPPAVFPPNQVPSIGLPLLMEYRCFPSNSGIGLNAFDISLAINSSARPNFRAFSTGGVNTSGMQIMKNPDLEVNPTGGFNPGSTPPGAPTAQVADNSFYIGQLDVVIRVSRVHTIWLDSQNPAPDYLTPVVEPRASQQPEGTQVVLAYRGVDLFSSGTSSVPFDASMLNAYGDIPSGAGVTATFHNGVSTWTNDINAVDGAKFLQMRFSFINNLATSLNAELSAVGVAFVRQ